MILNHLSIVNYKNIAQAELDFSPKINLFIGSNGEGKTNILDAIYFLSFTRSATHAAQDSLCIRHGEQDMLLAADYDLEGSPEHVTCGLRLHQKKVLRRNRKAYRRMSEHIGLLPLILISPSDNELVTGGSDERRRFMDIVISQYNPTYLAQLSRYNNVLQQRNALLRQHSQQPASTPLAPDAGLLLDTYERMMAEAGTYIYNERARYIDALIPIFQNYYSRLSCSREQVGLAYTSHAQRGPLLEVIQRDRQRDLVVGYSLHGVHRDDLDMTLGGFPIRREGSQGQTKTYLVSLKLAQFDFLRNVGARTKPLLLLDDIFDKLDARRVAQIIDLVGDDHFGQIFITDTNRENLDRILSQAAPSAYRIFSVSAGNIAQQPSDSRPA